MQGEKQEDEFVETRTLNGDDAVAAVRSFNSSRNQHATQRRAAQVELLYEAYLKACEEAGLEPHPPKHSK